MALSTPSRQSIRALREKNPRKALRMLGPGLFERPVTPLEFLAGARACYLLHHYKKMRRLTDTFTPQRLRALPPVFRGHYHFYLAKCFQSDMRLLTACDHFVTAAKTFHHCTHVREEAETWLAVSDIYRHMQGPARALATDALNRAWSCIERMIPGRRREALVAKYHGHAGRCLLSSGEFAQAKTHFEINRGICLNLDDTDTALLMHLHEAWCALELKEYDRAWESLRSVTGAYVRRFPKQALYARAIHAGLLAGQGDTLGATRVARRLWHTLKRTHHTDMLLHELLARTLHACRAHELCREVCRKAITRVENARRRLNTPDQMREFRENWSRFYQMLVMELAHDRHRDTLAYHVMNQSRTLFDLLSIAVVGDRGPPGADHGRLEQMPGLAAVEARLKGGRGGAALNPVGVRKAANVVLNALPRATLLLPTWYEGRLVFVEVFRRKGAQGASVAVHQAACPDPRRVAGKVRAQHHFAQWMAARGRPAQAEDGLVVLIPDDLTRGIAFHTAWCPPPLAQPAFTVTPMVYHVSLPALALQVNQRNPRRLGRVGLLNIPGPPNLRAGPEVALIERILNANERIEIRRAAASGTTLAAALRDNDLVHLAGHHSLHQQVEGYSAFGTRGEDPISVAGLLRGGRPRARYIVAAMCHSASTRSPIFNEPVGFLSALLVRGVRGIVAARAPISGEESVAWMGQYYTVLAGSESPIAPRRAYFETMKAMYAQWNVKERVGKSVYYGI